MLTGVTSEVGTLRVGGIGDLVAIRHDPDGRLADTGGVTRAGGCWEPVLVALAGEARSSFTAYALDGEVTTDRQALVSLVSAKLRRPIEIPNLDGAGYRYAGGRLVATAHGVHHGLLKVTPRAMAA